MAQSLSLSAREADSFNMRLLGATGALARHEASKKWVKIGSTHNVTRTKNRHH